MPYDKAAISKRFQKGKSLLDHAYYNEAIEIFTELINETDPLKDQDPDARVTWDTSHNNRGVAKCKSGYSSGNKALYEAGLDDFRTTVSYEMDLERRRTLTAQVNLTYGEQEIKDFDTRKGVNFKFEEL